MNNGMRARPLAAAAAVLLALAACESAGPSDPDVSPGDPPEGGIFGPQGLNLLDLGGLGSDRSDSPGALGVNGFLWRASLDTTSFMPLASADPFGGVIITDWYSPPETPDDRFKVTVYILDRQLRADGLRVAMFRQRRDGGGEWRFEQVTKETVTRIEDQILVRARQLRSAATAGAG